MSLLKIILCYCINVFLLNCQQWPVCDCRSDTRTPPSLSSPLLTGGPCICWRSNLFPCNENVSRCWTQDQGRWVETETESFFEPNPLPMTILGLLSILCEVCPGILFTHTCFCLLRNWLRGSMLPSISHCSAYGWQGHSSWGVGEDHWNSQGLQTSRGDGEKAILVPSLCLAHIP